MICRRRLTFTYASCCDPLAARSVYIDVHILSELIYDHAADAYAVIFFGYTYGKVRFCEISEEVISMEETHLKELDNAAIGARIRARRESLDMTRADLAGRIPLNEKSVAEIEYGNRGLSLKTLFRLKQILGVSTDYILEGDPELPDRGGAEKHTQGQHHGLPQHLFRGTACLHGRDRTALHRKHRNG